MSKPPATGSRILFVDPDDKYWDALFKEYEETAAGSQTRLPKPVFADSLNDAQAQIVDGGTYVAIFINPRLGEPIWHAVLRSGHRYCPGVPLYLLGDDKVRMRQSEAVRLGISGIFVKPLSYAKALSVANHYEGDELTLASPYSEREAESQKTDDYVEISIGAVTGQHRSLFDLYVRLPSGKLVRILRAGDALTPERIDSYKQRGLKAYCILKRDQDRYLTFCDELISKSLNDQRLDAGSKLAQISSYGASTLNFLRRCGFKESTLDHAVKSVERTAQLVEQMAQSNEHVRKLIDDVAALEHSVACATLAAVFMRHIGGMNPSLVATVGLAAFLHDLALVGEAPEIVSENENLMTDDQLVIYHAHPDVGARMLERTNSVPQMVIDAVYDHHLRRGGEGFPEERAVADVNRLSELIGLCHDLLDGVRRSKSDRRHDPVARVREEAPVRFSETIVDAFVRAFEAK